MFTEVVGQDRAVETLRRTSERPSHAYLLVGPRGSGVEDAARDFAALLIGAGDDERSVRLVQRGVHPDVVEFAPGGPSYRVKEDVRDTILPEAARAPIEAERRVLILFEAERLRGNQNESANAMLKTIEEPPPRTIVLLVTAAPDDLLPTIRSRCQRVDFDPVADDVLQAALEREGVDPETAARAAALGGGQLARARALAGPLAPLRAAFAQARPRGRRHRRHGVRPRRRARRRGRPGGRHRDRAARRGARRVRRRDGASRLRGTRRTTVAAADRGAPAARGAAHARSTCCSKA